MPVTRELRQKVFERANGKCSICGREDVPLEIDHIVPHSKGGSDTLSNLRAVCRSCNVLVSRTPSNRLASLREAASRGYQFEQTVHRLLHEMGFAVVSGATGPDGGADLIARGADPVSHNNVTFVVQCKYTRGNIRKETIAQLASTKEHTGADYAILVSNKQPTPATLELARRFGISVLATDDLAERVASLWRAGDDG